MNPTTFRFPGRSLFMRGVMLGVGLLLGALCALWTLPAGAAEKSKSTLSRHGPLVFIAHPRNW